MSSDTLRFRVHRLSGEQVQSISYQLDPHQIEWHQRYESSGSRSSKNSCVRRPGCGRWGRGEHRWRSRPGGWATGFCDLESGRLLEVVQGRSGADARGFLASEIPEVRGQVGVVALDPWRGYLTPARELLPEATVTVEGFYCHRGATWHTPLTKRIRGRKPPLAA